MAKGLGIQNIRKTYGDTHALDGVSFEVAEGEIIALLGPSGSGKSTLLAVVAGLENPDSGDISWDSASLRGVPPHRRGFGLMFQDFALFPHMSVYDNVAFGLRMANEETGVIQQRVTEMLKLVGLDGFEKRDVNTLSGGEQQRVALARSLAPHPRLLMLDEPLGSLDRNLRERLILELRSILQKMQQTAIYVTHDQEEAFSLADRVVLMNAGRIEQIGTPVDLYRRPTSLFVARFLGLANLVPGEVIHIDGQTLIETQLGRLPTDMPQPPGPVTVLLRPDSMRVEEDGQYVLEGKLIESTFRGSTSRAVVDIQGVYLTFDFLSSIDLPSQGEKIRLSYSPNEAIQLVR